MPSVNLAPGTQHIIAARRRRTRLFFVAFAIIVVLALTWTGVFLYRQQLESQLTETDEQLRTVGAELARLDDQARRVEAFEKQLSSLSILLEEHVMWEPLLQGIERLLPTTTRITSLEMKGDTAEVFISGKTPDVDQLSQTLASLESDNSPFNLGKLSQVTRVETPAGEGEPPIVDYVFEVELTFDRNLLAP